MKATGVVRRLDPLGRLCIPAELRRALKVGERDCLEFYLDGDKLVLQKYNAVGDMEQVLENAERGIQQNSALLPETAKALLSKMDEMKAILAESGRK